MTNHSIRFPPSRGLLILASVVAFSVMPSTVNAEDFAAFDAGRENRAGLTFSPDGNSAYWVEWNGRWGEEATSPRTIYRSARENGTWGPPSPMLFTTTHADDDPFVSPDGRWLYFVSNRPVDEADELADSNIWRFSLSDGGQLEHLNINSDAEEFSPVVTASGAIYFASNRDGGMGRGDLYRAPVNRDGFDAPRLLGPALNSESGEWNLWVAADESEIVFEASSRPTNVSVPGDLYYSWKTPVGWTHAVPLAALNSEGSDLLPRPAYDGETLVYTTAPIGGHADLAAAIWGDVRSRARESYAPMLLVANRSSHEVTMVNLAMGEVVARMPTGEGPHLLSNVDNGRVVASGFGEFPRPHEQPVTARPPFVESLNSRLTMIGIAEQVPLLDIIINDCDKPHATWLLGQLAYISCEPANEIAVVDLTTGHTIERIDTLQQGSHVLSYVPFSRTLASSNTGSGSVTLVELDSGERTVVPLAPGSEGALAINGQIWIGNAFDKSVSIVDPRAAAEVQRIESVCSFPIAFGQDAERQVWVACFASSEIVSISPDTFEINRRISLGDQPLNIAVHPSRMLAYVSLPRQNAVAEISLTSGKELRRIAVGIEPDGLRWATTY